MFNLIKDAIDVVFILFVFYAGMKVQQNYPNLLSDIKGVFASIGNIFTFLKGLASKL
jgi:hypothetical protein